ncbi:putative RNA-directed DNA polymerase from transposon X-element [Trichonephila clavipes]|nr:putative RNA-directed DNA polymerase from transposon X-element [Trichonephila clavipes]
MALGASLSQINLGVQVENRKTFLRFGRNSKKFTWIQRLQKREKTFQYLLQYVVPDSEAAKLVSSFPPTKDNYSKAITQLEKRFGRDEFLVQIYVRDFLSIVMKNEAGRIKVDLLELYDLLESKLMAFESLVHTKEKFAEFLEPLVESCSPETVLRVWERSRSVEDSSLQDSECSLDKLLCFLRNEVQSEEMIKLSPGWELRACRILVLTQMNLIALHLQLL